MTSLREAWLDCRSSEMETFEIAERMLEKYPVVVNEWLAASTLSRVTAWVGDQENAERHRARSRSKAAELDSVEDGDGEGLLSIFDSRAPFLTKHIGECKREDIDEIIGFYQRDVDDAEFHKLVWKQVRKKVGLRRVDEVYTEEQLAAMFAPVDKTERKAS